MKPSLKVAALLMIITGATWGATTQPASRPTTTSQPASRAAVPHTWKWDDTMFATADQVNELKEKLIGMTLDEMYAALKSNNFTPPGVSSKTRGKTVYKTACRVKNAKGHQFAYHFTITVDASGVSAFSHTLEDEDNPGVLVPQ